MKKDYIEPMSAEIELLTHAIVMVSGDEPLDSVGIEQLSIEEEDQWWY